MGSWETRGPEAEDLLASSGTIRVGDKGPWGSCWKEGLPVALPLHLGREANFLRPSEAGLGTKGTDPHFLSSTLPAALGLGCLSQSRDPGPGSFPSPGLPVCRGRSHTSLHSGCQDYAGKGVFTAVSQLPALPVTCPHVACPSPLGGLSLTPQPQCLHLAWVEADHCLPMWGPWVLRLKTGLG